MSKLIEITGKALSGEWGTDDEIGNGIPVLRTTNFTHDGVVNYKDIVTRTITKKNISDKFLRKGDIIIEKSGGSDKQPVGRVIYFDGDENTYLFNNFTGLLRVKDVNVWFPKYVFYSLFYNYKNGGTRRFENKTTGLHNLKTDVYIDSFEVKDIDLTIQKDICEQLDWVREIVELRKQQLTKLDELIKARFVEMFGDPVASKNKRKLSEIGRVFTGNTPSMKEPSYYESNDIPFIKPSDLNESGVTIIDGVEAYVSEKARPVARIIPPNAVLVTCIGTIGKIGITTNESCCNQQINFIVPNSDIDTTYLAYCLTFFKDVLANIANAPVVPIINKTQFSELEIPVFEVDMQHQFVVFVEQVDKSKLSIQKSLEKLELLKNSLMQQYFG